MSTKTTFKRVALVAVAALGFGTLSVAPSNAYTVEAGFRTLSWGATPSATGTTLVEWSAVVKVAGSCGEYGTNPDLTAVFATTTAQLDSAPTGSNLLGNSPTWSTGTPTGYTNTNATAAVAAFSNAGTGYKKATQVSCSSADSAMVGYSTVKFTPDKAGVYTLVLVPLGATTGALTQTITVSDPTQKFATAFINTSASPTADAATLSYASTTNTTVDAYLTVRQYSTTDATTLATAPISKDVVVAISKGLVSKTNDFFAGAKSVTTAAAVAATNDYYVFANGEVGSADLTITVGGTLLATKKIAFSGPAKTLSAALTSGQKSWIAPNGTTTLTVTAKDEAGNAATALPTTMTATSATTTVATATIAAGVVTITGVAAGTSVITIADSATSSPAASATYTVTVAPAISATLPTITFDKAEYNAGELMTITIGAAAADNTAFKPFSAAPTTSVNVVTVKNPFAAETFTVALVAGKATWTAYAPITAGPISVTATSSTAGSTPDAAAVTATATVLTDGVAQAAADAAAEAIDAANAATDAANAAAEAADAATAAAQDAADAVAALSVQVSEQIAELKAQNDALRKQLIALTNLIIKIQKKVKA